MEVIILAGGLGTRLRSSIGDSMPKCMAPVDGRPFISYLLEYLSKFNVTRVVLSVGHLRDVIIDWIDNNNENYPFSIDYAIETTPLGTGGGIKLALEKCIGENVIILNGDTFFDVNLDDFFQDHKLYLSTISVALKRMTHFSRYGQVVFDSSSHIIRQFCEKEPCEAGYINGGIYAINRKYIRWPEKEKFSFENDVLEKQTVTERIFGFNYDGYFIDIGVPSDYQKAQNEFKNLFQ